MFSLDILLYVLVVVQLSNCRRLKRQGIIAFPNTFFGGPDRPDYAVTDEVHDCDKDGVCVRRICRDDFVIGLCGETVGTNKQLLKQLGKDFDRGLTPAFPWETKIEKYKYENFPMGAPKLSSFSPDLRANAFNFGGIGNNLRYLYETRDIGWQTGRRKPDDVLEYLREIDARTPPEGQKYPRPNQAVRPIIRQCREDYDCAATDHCNKRHICIPGAKGVHLVGSDGRCKSNKKLCPERYKCKRSTCYRRADDSSFPFMPPAQYTIAMNSTTAPSHQEEDDLMTVYVGVSFGIVAVLLILIPVLMSWISIRKRSKLFNQLIDDLRSGLFTGYTSLDSIEVHLSTIGYSLSDPWHRSRDEATGTISCGSGAWLNSCWGTPTCKYQITLEIAGNKVVGCRSIIDRTGSVNVFTTGLAGCVRRNRETENLHRLFTALTTSLSPQVNSADTFSNIL